MVRKLSLFSGIGGDDLASECAGYYDPEEAQEAIDREAREIAIFKVVERENELEKFDAGYLNDFGGGNVEWWFSYIRDLLSDAHDFYVAQTIINS